MTTKKRKASSMINRGLLIVYGPLVSFVVASGFVATWFATNILNFEISGFLVLATFLASIFIGWIWWSYKIVKWKCWAFSQIGIEGSYKLYLKAIEAGLIWPKGSIFNKTEIWAKEDRKTWNKIEPEIRGLFDEKQHRTRS